MEPVWKRMESGRLTDGDATILKWMDRPRCHEGSLRRAGAGAESWRYAVLGEAVETTDFLTGPLLRSPKTPYGFAAMLCAQATTQSIAIHTSFNGAILRVGEFSTHDASVRAGFSQFAEKGVFLR